MSSATQNGWFNLLRLGMIETTDFIYGDQIDVEYSEEYAFDVSVSLNKIAGRFVKCGK